MTIGGGFWYASQLTIHHPLPWGQRRQEVVEVEREGNGYVPMLRAVTDAIRAGALEHPVHTAAATAEIYATCDEIRRQITRVTVSVIGSESVPSVIVSTSSPGSRTKRFSSSQKPSSSAAQLERHGRRLAGSDRHPSEAAQPLHRLGERGDRIGQVDEHDVVAVAFADIAHRGGGADA